MKSVYKLHARKRFKWTLALIVLIVGLVLITLFALGTGPVPIPRTAVAKILVNKISLGYIFQQTWEPVHETIVIDVRLPRVVLGVLVGSALATAGCALQGLFKNPMASPYILGVASGAAFGAALGLVLGISLYSLPLTAFLFALLAVFIVYNIARTRGRVPIETLLLSGIAVGLFFSALVSLLVYVAGERIYGIVFWMMGGFWASSWDKVVMIFPLIILGIIMLFLFAKDLNALLFGEEPAMHLGIEVETIKKIILVFSALITAAAISVVGTIGFVGLIIPHMMRIVVGPDHRILLPSSMMFGAIFLVGTDTLARSVIQPTEIPVGIITALFGAPFFVYLLKARKKQTWW